MTPIIVAVPHACIKATTLGWKSRSVRDGDLRGLYSAFLRLNATSLRGNSLPKLNLAPMTTEDGTASPFKVYNASGMSGIFANNCMCECSDDGALRVVRRFLGLLPSSSPPGSKSAMPSASSLPSQAATAASCGCANSWPKSKSSSGNIDCKPVHALMSPGSGAASSNMAQSASMESMGSMVSIGILNAMELCTYCGPLADKDI
mmetsp:Transcript_60824/g.144944  ORF Transcript_60824/g.144944 Transcript_60824/m.144944 type:complete len:204 (-) Transcript_60824:13-624(-)